MVTRATQPGSAGRALYRYFARATPRTNEIPRRCHREVDREARRAPVMDGVEEGRRAVPGRGENSSARAMNTSPWRSARAGSADADEAIARVGGADAVRPR